MSTRALRKLRGDVGLIPQNLGDDSDESSDDEEPSQARRLATAKPRSAFAAVMEDDESSQDDEDTAGSQDDDDNPSKTAGNVGPEEGTGKTNPVSATSAADDEEDLDALLNEFQMKDEVHLVNEKEEDLTPSLRFSKVLEGLDVRDLDFDQAMLNMLHSGKAGNKGWKNRPSSLFGTPREAWVRPPHYVGGGIGMTTYEREPRKIPWPYQGAEIEDATTESTVPPTEPKEWYSYKYSDSYEKDLDDFKQIQLSGDVNALILFVAHHPYVVEALLQLSTLLYQTNNSQEGLAIIRRCLWVFELSALSTFVRTTSRTALVDAGQPENFTFFSALFWFAKISNMSGLPRTAAAASRLLLSMDPLRDPLCVLPILDHYVLACRDHSMDQWLVDCAESCQILVVYRDTAESNQTYSCDIRGMPNWMYSYALACFRIAFENQSDTAKGHADIALKQALRQYPHVAGLLLQENDVDTTGRSFRRDWISVLDYASDRARSQEQSWSKTSAIVELSATLQAVDALVRVYVQHSARLWGDDAIMQWLYDNLMDMKKNDTDLQHEPSFALMRYADLEVSEYDTRIQQLPAELQAVDPHLLAHALVVEPNRRRFLRNRAREGEHGNLGEDFNALGGPHNMFGPPTQVINPDWPLLEVLWRSFLPWNRVEGVPPPPRR